MNALKCLLGLCLLFLGFYAKCIAQSPDLNWVYEQIVHDEREQGAFPDITVEESSGVIHCAYWEKALDRLMYSYGIPGDLRLEFIDPGRAGGWRSAIVLDNSETPHIAFYAKAASGNATLSYAVLQQGVWVVEDIPIPDDIGPYGNDQDFPIHTQASLDIIIKPDGLPLISFFDASVRQINWCSVSQIYTDYDLKLEFVEKLADGSWRHSAPERPDYVGNEDCLVYGDRFGEFCQMGIVGNEVWCITNSLHNHQLLLFKSALDNLGNWESVVLDDLKEVAPISYEGRQNNQFREGFDHISAHFSEDRIDLVYGLSDLYGQSTGTFYHVKSDAGRRSFWYAQILVDSIGEEIKLQNKIALQNPQKADDFLSHDGEYRSYFSINRRSTTDSLYIAFLNASKEELHLLSSFDNGKNWSQRRISSASTNAPLKLFTPEFEEQGIFLQNNRAGVGILESWRPVNGIWTSDQISHHSNSSAHFVGSQTKDSLFVLFEESISGELLLASKGIEEQLWTTYCIDTLKEEPDELVLASLADGNKIIGIIGEQRTTVNLIYWQNRRRQSINLKKEGSFQGLEIHERDQQIELFYQDLGSGELIHEWVDLVDGQIISSMMINLAESGLLVKEFAVAVSDDTIYLAMTDLENSKIYLGKLLPGSDWDWEPVIGPKGQLPDQLELIHDNENLFLCYRDALSGRLYELRMIGEEWEQRSITDQILTSSIVNYELDQDINGKWWLAYGLAEQGGVIGLLRKNEEGVWEEIVAPAWIEGVSLPFTQLIGGRKIAIIGNAKDKEKPGLAMQSADYLGILSSGKSELPLLALSIHPNPFDGIVEFLVSKGVGGKLMLRDMVGRTIWQTDIVKSQARLSVDLTSLAPGTYFCQWMLPNGNLISRRLIKR